jgi:hypothetical protein
MGRTGNLIVDQLLYEYDETEKSEWLDKVFELVKSNSVGKEELYTLLEKVVEKEEEGR